MQLQASAQKPAVCETQATEYHQTTRKLYDVPVTGT